MQEQSFTTSHQQVHTQPLSEQKPPWKVSAHLLSPSSSAPAFIVEHDVMWYGKHLWTVQGSCPSLLLIPSLFPVWAEWGKKKALLSKLCSIIPKTLLCHCSDPFRPCG